MKLIETVQRENHIQWLFEANSSLLGTYLSQDLIQRFQRRIVSSDECKDVHDCFERALFVDELTRDSQQHLSEVMRNSPSEFRVLTDKLVAEVAKESADFVGSIYDAGVVPVLIRPELLYLGDHIRKILLHHGMEIFHEVCISLTFRQYWSLYEHVFGNRVKEMHVRRRSVGYLNRPCHLVLLRQRNSDAQRLSEYLINRVKGDAGFYEKGTLRGDVIFCELSRVVADDNPRDFFAFDPLMDYEYNDDSIYKSGIASKLHANIQGIHIPEPHEVLKDLSVLVQPNEAREIIKKL